MLISIAIGLGLKNVNDAKDEVQRENFLLQTTVILDDVMGILKNTPELNDINDSDTFRVMLESYSMPVPLSSSIMVDIDLQSARSKFNINSLKDSNGTKDAILGYLNHKMVNPQYIYLLKDLMSGVREDGIYYSAIFNERPYLFRDYISSKQQIKELNEYYKQHTMIIQLINLI